METTESKRFFAELEIVRFEETDVITASSCPCVDFCAGVDCYCIYVQGGCPNHNP